MAINILVVTSSKKYYNDFRSILTKMNLNTFYCNTVEKAFNEASNHNYDILISDFDIWKRKISLSNFTKLYPDTEIIITANNPTYKDAGIAISQGATEYIPLNKGKDFLIKAINKAIQCNSNRNSIKKTLMTNYLLESKNKKYNKMLELCLKVARSNANILLVGESGTGKEVAAKYIHLYSQRSAMPFIAVNCSAFTDTLLESELFGHEEGAYTGAIKARKGRFEIANKGTLFLDEIGDISLTTQVKLLRAIETKTIQRLGSNIDTLIDFRLISATNKDLKSEILNNNFREDFIYRISTIVIKVPTLRERKEDLESLINFFLEKAQTEHGIKISNMEPEVKKFLYSYDYPGNIRELKNIIDRMVVFSENGTITKDGIPIMFAIRKSQKNSYDSSFNEVKTFKEFKKLSESKYLEWVLKQTNGNVTEAARQLDISSRQLFNKINEYNIKK